MIEDNNAVLLAEYRLLNACYSNPDFVYENGVTEDIFQHSQSKTIFNSIKSLYESKIPLTRESLWQDASNHDLGINNSIIDQVIDFTFQKPETIKDIVDSLNMAKRAAKAEKDIDEAKKLINSSLVRNDETNNKLKELLFSVEENLFTLYNKQGPMTLEEWGKVYQAEYLGRRNGKTYYFNDRILDALITTGPTPGSGGLITASSGMGKSSYVLNLINNLINRDIPVLYFSLEMGKIDTYDRLVSIRTQIPFKNLVNPEDPSEWASYKDRIEEEHEVLSKHVKFRFCDDPEITLNDIESYIRKFQADIGVQYCIVVIDLVTMVQDFASVSGGVSLANQIEFAINKLNAIAKTCGIHYIGIAQLNRKVEEDKVRDPEDIPKLRPNRAAIKNSNALLERCRYVISLFRPKYFADTYLSVEEFPEIAEMEDIIEVGVMKQNNGMTGRAECKFDGATFTVAPIENPDLDD